MHKVKITVLKTTLDKELTDEYGIQNLSTCPFHRPNQVFFADYETGEPLQRGLEGDELFYYGDWIKKPGVAICSYSDGLRPVIFKPEKTDEMSGPE